MPRKSSLPKLIYRAERDCYYIRTYRGGTQSERSLSTNDERAAQKALAKFILQENGENRLNKKSSPEHRLIAESLALYIQEHAPHTKAPATISYSADRLLEFFGDDTINKLTPARCREYTQYRKIETKERKAVSDATIRRELTVLQSAINFDYKNGTLTEPRPVWKPKSPKSKERWITQEEAERLFQAAQESPEHLQTFLALALYTGARKSAILQLKWSQVDLDRGFIDYNIIGEAATRKRRSLIPIAELLMPYLQRAKERGTENGYVIHINQQPIKDIKKTFNTTCIRASLKDVTPHTLRHTCATWLVQAGVPFAEVAAYLNDSVQTVEKVYAHHSPNYLQNAVKIFGKPEQ